MKSPLERETLAPSHPKVWLLLRIPAKTGRKKEKCPKTASQVESPPTLAVWAAPRPRDRPVWAARCRRVVGLGPSHGGCGGGGCPSPHHHHPGASVISIGLLSNLSRRIPAARERCNTGGGSGWTWGSGADTPTPSSGC